MYNVSNDGSYILYILQVLPYANLLTPRPALLFIVMNGVSSNGTMVIVGTGQVETQPMAVAAVLPVVQTVMTMAAKSGALDGKRGWLSALP